MALPLDWTITHFSQTWTGQGLYIQVTTDVPCTLYLLWTTITPRLHLRSLNKRGLGMMDDPYYCFVEWNRVEQWIKGDATHHSFFLGDWKPGEYRWYIFVATFAGQFSQSTSPIFAWPLEEAEVAAPLVAPFTAAVDHIQAPTSTISALLSTVISHLKSISPATATFTVQVTALQQPAAVVATFTVVIPWLHVEPAIKAQYFTEVTGP